MLVPPANFGVAEDGIYRCSKIETLNLSFLETLNLKTVIIVGGQEPSKFFKEFFEQWCIKCHVVKTTDVSSTLAPVNIGPHNEKTVENASTKNTPRNSDVQYELTDNDDLMLIKVRSLKVIFKLLLDTKNYNTLLVDKTSIVVGMLRKIQKWSISSIVNEYRLFTGKNSSYFAETFLELVNIKVVQEQEDKLIEDVNNLSNNQNLMPADMVRRASTQEIVNETDLYLSPTLPRHILRVLEEAEAEATTSSVAQRMELLKRSQSNLGIFGHKYRLAFNKRERCDYEYYKSRGQNSLELNIPGESFLPTWFKFQRDLWEQENTEEEHNFYKESIFV